jgi:hypothetical protein
LTIYNNGNAAFSQFEALLVRNQQDGFNFLQQIKHPTATLDAWAIRATFERLSRLNPRGYATLVGDIDESLEQVFVAGEESRRHLSFGCCVRRSAAREKNNGR